MQFFLLSVGTPAIPFWYFLGLPGLYTYLLLQWHPTTDHTAFLSLWFAAPAMLVWAIWFERNQRIFRRTFKSINSVWHHFELQLIHLWEAYP